jgi:L-aspartate oxidase
MGGVLTDARGRTTVDGLWACGEVASTGAHGGNRLASNSLLEAVVFGNRVAADIMQKVPPAAPRGLEPYANPPAQTVLEADSDAVTRLRQTMSAKVGVIRDAASLTAALSVIASLEPGAAADPRIHNMLTTAKLIAISALLRRESRGAQFRSDFPQADPRLAQRSVLTLAEAEMAAREALERRERGQRHASLSA